MTWQAFFGSDLHKPTRIVSNVRPWLAKCSLLLFDWVLDGFEPCIKCLNDLCGFM